MNAAYTFNIINDYQLPYYKTESDLKGERKKTDENC